MFLDVQFRKGSPKAQLCEIILKSDRWLQRRRLLRISSRLYSASSPHSPEPCLSTDQNFANNFWKEVTKGTFLWNYFKIRQAVFEKIFFLRYPSCPYGASSPHTPKPCFTDRSKFGKQVFKGVTQEHLCEIISKSDRQFQRRRFFFLRIFSCPFSASSPHSTEPYLLMDQQYLKRVTQGMFLSNYSKIWPRVSERKIFLRISSYPYSAINPHFPGPCLLTDQNFANNFWKGSSKEHFYVINSKSDQQFQRSFLRIAHVCIAQVAPIHQSHVYWLIKI